MFPLRGIQVGDTVTTAVETMVVVGKLGVTVTSSVVVVAMVEYAVVLRTFVVVNRCVVVTILVSVVVETLVSVVVETLVTVSLSIAVEVLMTVCVLVIVCLSVTVDMWVVGVALAQKLLRNLSTFSSH